MRTPRRPRRVPRRGTARVDSRSAAQALAMALNQFDGGVVFVSHDERLIEMVADELWVVDRGVGGRPGSVHVWHSSYEEYKERLQSEFAASISNNMVKGV